MQSFVIKAMTHSCSIVISKLLMLTHLDHINDDDISSNDTRVDTTHEHQQMVNTEIRLITFFAAKDGEALYSQRKQD